MSPGSVAHEVRRGHRRASAERRRPARASEVSAGVPPLPRRLAAEVLGTFFLTFVASAASMIGAVDPAWVPPVARAAAGGLLVMVMIYAIGPISGAHMNPAITLGFTLRGVFPVRHLALYWAAEMAGALLAAWALRALLGNFDRLGAPVAAHGPPLAFGLETILSVLLVTVVLGTATHHAVIGANAAIAVGATIALAGLVAGSMSGAALNPARSLAPMILASSYRDAWLYVAGPVLGAIIAAALARLLHGPHRDDEREMSEGNDA